MTHWPWPVKDFSRISMSPSSPATMICMRRPRILLAKIGQSATPSTPVPLSIVLTWFKSTAGRISYPLNLPAEWLLPTSPAPRDLSLFSCCQRPLATKVTALKKPSIALAPRLMTSSPFMSVLLNLPS